MPLLSLLLALALLYPAAPAWRWPVEPPEVLRPFDPPEQRWLPGHLGVDLTAEPGQRVYAAGSGRVHFSGTVAGTPVVSVSHGELRTTYLPVESDLVRGDPVAMGEPLGTLATEPVHCRDRPCLHWGLLRGDAHLDPLALLGLGDFRLLPLPPTAPRLHTAGSGRARTRTGPVRRGGGPDGRCRAGAPRTRACRSACCAGWRGPGTPARCAGRRHR